MPKISFIVPVYKVEKYLPECVDSLLAQTETDVEIILIDDGSPDGSGAICDSYAESDKRVRVIHQENQGVSVARNNGLAVASGEWITFIDGDDYVDSRLTEEILALSEKIDADVVMCSFYTVKGGNNIRSKLINLPSGFVSDRCSYIQKKIITQYYDENTLATGPSPGTCWGKFIRKEKLNQIKVKFIPGLVRAQDTVFWLNVFEKIDTIYLYDKCLYYYRITDTNVTSGNKYIENSEQVFGKLLKAYQSFIKECNKETLFRKAFLIRTLQILLWNIEHNYFNESNPSSLVKRLKALKKLCNCSPYSIALCTDYYKNIPKASGLLLFLCKHHLYLLCFCAFRIKKLIKSKKYC